MRACRLRASFAQATRGSPRTPTAPQLLGLICHSVLEWLTESKAILSDSWEQELEARWQDETTSAAKQLASDHCPSPLPAEWDGYSIKHARLRKAARRLRELLAPLGPRVELVVEQPLSANDGRIRGRPDLIVRSDQGHWLVDYKTGPVISRESREPRESYVRQLRLYAYMQAETNGEWPQRAFLLPLQGPLVEIDVDPRACRGIAAEAIELLNSYNAHAPVPQPPSPAPDTCRWCPYAARCPAFWDSCDSSWQPTVLAAAGVASGAAHPALGGTSVTVHAEVGSLDQGPVKVRSISSEDHPEITELNDGDQLALVGLRLDRGADSFALPEAGRVSIWPR